MPHLPAGPCPASNPHSESLVPFGWTSSLADAFWEHAPEGGEPGRVVAASRGLSLVQSAAGELWCEPSGRFRRHLEADGLIPVAGDWIALRRPEGALRGQVLGLHPRGSSLSRQSGDGRQWLAANVDTVLVLSGLDRDFNVGRLERLLALAWGSGARPVVVLTKADLAEEPEAFVRRVEGVAPGVEVRTVSSHTGEGLGGIRDLLAPGSTSVMVGSSGVGKSSLLNALAGHELRRTQEVRSSDGRGKHTTSLRELFLLPGCGCLIDTPGLREVGLSAEGSNLDGAFSEIAALAEGCRFRDCSHGAEPGCAVQAALAEGLLDPHRYGHFLRLRREVEYEAARSDARLWREREDKWKKIHKSMRHFTKG